MCIFIIAYNTLLRLSNTVKLTQNLYAETCLICLACGKALLKVLLHLEKVGEIIEM